MENILKTKYGLIFLLFIFWGCSNVFFDAFYDTDKDTIPNTSDNCKYTPNQDQSDKDLDGQGDACDNVLSISLPDLVDTTVYLPSGNNTIDVMKGAVSGPIDTCMITSEDSDSLGLSVSVSGDALTCVVSIPGSIRPSADMYQVTVLATNALGADSTPALVTFYILNLPDLVDTTVHLPRGNNTIDVMKGAVSGPIDTCMITSEDPDLSVLSVSVSGDALTCVVSIPGSVPPSADMYQVTILATNALGADSTPALVTFYVLNLPDLIHTTVHLPSGNNTIDVMKGAVSGPIDTCMITSEDSDLSVLSVSVSGDALSCVVSIPGSIRPSADMYQATVLATNALGADSTPALVTFYILNPPGLQDGNFTFTRTIPQTTTLINNDTTGNITSCIPNTSLPMGLTLSPSLDAKTCIISGIPTESTTSTLSIMITVSNTAGLTQDVMADIEVNEPDAGHSITITLDGVSFIIKYVPAKGLEFPIGSLDTGTAVMNWFYYIMETEVTSALWKKVVEWAKNNSYTFDERSNYLSVSSNDNIPVISHWYNGIKFANALTEYYNSLNPSQPLTLAYGATPAEQKQIREDALASSPTIVSITNNPSASGFRLPSNHEWELAARFIADSNNDGDISDSGEYYPGNYASGATADTSDATETQKVAWYSANSPGVLQVVKGKSANALGLYDMSGNAKELLFDSTGRPERKQLRGGSIESGASNVRVSRDNNDFAAPNAEFAISGSTGFRLVSRR